MGEKGIIFPDVPEEQENKAVFDARTQNYVWKYASVVEVPEEERAQFGNFDKRLDVENAKVFGQYDFMGACKEMGIAQDIKR